jgi:hypothetical protein
VKERKTRAGWSSSPERALAHRRDSISGEDPPALVSGEDVKGGGGASRHGYRYQIRYVSDTRIQIFSKNTNMGYDSNILIIK